MNAYESYVDDASVVVNLYNQSVLVTSDVKHDPVVPDPIGGGGSLLLTSPHSSPSSSRSARS